METIKPGTLQGRPDQVAFVGDEGIDQQHLLPAAVRATRRKALQTLTLIQVCWLTAILEDKHGSRLPATRRDLIPRHSA